VAKEPEGGFDVPRSRDARRIADVAGDRPRGEDLEAMLIRKVIGRELDMLMRAARRFGGASCVNVGSSDGRRSVADRPRPGGASLVEHAERASTRSLDGMPFADNARPLATRCQARRRRHGSEPPDRRRRLESAVRPLRSAPGPSPRSVLARLVLAAGLALLAGCVRTDPHRGPHPLAEPLDAEGEAVGEPSPPLAFRWPYTPRELRVHPLTRVAAAGGTDVGGVAEEGYGVGTSFAGPGRLLDVHVEFLDRVGDSVKAVGPVWFELYPEGSARRRFDPAGGAAAGRIARWSVDLADPDRNDAHYDRVTRTYRFRLRLGAEAAPPDEARLHVHHWTAERRLSDVVTLHFDADGRP